MKGLVTNNVSTDFVKGMLESATQLVGVIDKITSSLGGIGTSSALLGIANLVKNFANFGEYSGLTGIGSVIANLGKSFSGIFSGALQGFSSGGFSGAISSIGAGFKSLISGAGLAKTAMIAFNAVLNGLAWGAIIGGIALAVKAWDNYAHATENAINASKEKQASIKEEMSNLNSQKSGLSSIAVEYDSLASKTNKSVEELQRYKELRQQIAEISPELVSG